MYVGSGSVRQGTYGCLYEILVYGGKAFYEAWGFHAKPLGSVSIDILNFS